MTVFQFIISDMVMILSLHLGLLIIFLSAILGSYRMKRDGASTKRGEKSWNYLTLFYGGLYAIVIQVISLSEFGKGYKVFITLMDLGILLYLVFFDSWFRNKIIGFVVKSQTKEEGR